LVFYESPHRLRDTLADLGEILGSDRYAVIARELTKLYEEFWRGTIGEGIANYQEKEPQGEYTLLIAGTPSNQPQPTETELKNELLSMIKQGISRSQASREIAKNTGLSRRYLYQLALTIEINL
jgi:16S rRNA (cytidine1402-2'-O)-methyltransferase